MVMTLDNSIQKRVWLKLTFSRPASECADQVHELSKWHQVKYPCLITKKGE